MKKTNLVAIVMLLTMNLAVHATKYGDGWVVNIRNVWNYSGKDVKILNTEADGHYGQPATFASLSTNPADARPQSVQKFIPWGPSNSMVITTFAGSFNLYDCQSCWGTLSITGPNPGLLKGAATHPSPIVRGVFSDASRRLFIAMDRARTYDIYINQNGNVAFADTLFGWTTPYIFE